MAKEKIVPAPDADSKPFWEACRDHKLKFQKCAACGEVRWPASILCPQCHCRDARWIEASGRGIIHTFVVYHQVFNPAFKDQIPYVVAVVELEEGPRLLTNIVDSPPESLSCDLPVEVVWDDISEEFSLPKFRPLPG
ncbi:MAG: Zn-ribbon domain-containing OB-fold protein [Desulfarculaceae bacterium]|nr:Zn-ribbon domain-containing OB-fold protein [Desulfarculaceae bacterium]MCF8074348.1 Zn-ribbon domain-containing OB-fold protein [Desulfarculaceae bacterium]MCF8103552.1 Zn-ribbon domain-containing OB-fold protein [Desulfarculaceae bacterium]MCF8117319.1 Zn-ribbon domain-containing OB-fold protein [Desulfarculaceae bacterium]